MKTGHASTMTPMKPSASATPLRRSIRSPTTSHDRIADIIGIVNVSTAAREVLVLSCASAVDRLKTAIASVPPMSTPRHERRGGNSGLR